MLLRDIAKSGCQFEMMWISLWCFVLRSVLEGQQDMLTHHPLQSYPVEKTCKMWYDPSNWHCSIELDISPKKNRSCRMKDLLNHHMLSTTNIAKSDCLTNFKHSNKAILRWCWLGLWWLVLRSVREGHHPLQIHPSPVMFFRKKHWKNMLQDLIWFLELTMYMEPLHSKKVRCVSHDTSHILNNPIITSEKKNFWITTCF